MATPAATGRTTITAVERLPIASGRKSPTKVTGGSSRPA
jgi:hypothetical protein